MHLIKTMLTKGVFGSYETCELVRLHIIEGVLSTLMGLTYAYHEVANQLLKIEHEWTNLMMSSFAMLLLASFFHRK